MKTASTCRPYTIEDGDGWVARCDVHDWQSEVWRTRKEAKLSSAGHRRSKRTPIDLPPEVTL